MSVKKALLYAFTIAIVLVFATVFIGHLWVFITLVATSLIGIVVSTIYKGKRSGSESSNDEQS
jgi:hypothetical protein